MTRSRLKNVSLKNQYTNNWKNYKYQQKCFTNLLRKTKFDYRVTSFKKNHFKEVVIRESQKEVVIRESQKEVVIGESQKEDVIGESQKRNTKAKIKKIRH